MSTTIERPSAAPGTARPATGAPTPGGTPAVAAVPAPGAPAAAGEAARTAAPARPNRVPLLVLGTLALVGLVFGVMRWRWGLTHVSTDDAQVEGHIIPTLARVAGYVAEVAVNENEP